MTSKMRRRISRKSQSTSPNRQPEGETHCPAIRRPDQDAVPGIGAFHLVSVDEIDVGPELSQKVVDFANIILSVSVGIENQDPFGHCVKPVMRAAPYPRFRGWWIARTKGSSPASRSAMAPVRSLLPSSMTMYFEVLRDLPYLLRGAAHDVFNRVLVVIGREECCERNPFHTIRRLAFVLVCRWRHRSLDRLRLSTRKPLERIAWERSPSDLIASDKRRQVRFKNVDSLRQRIDQVCHSGKTKLLNLKHLMFGEAIALSKASADFPLPNPKREL